VTLAVGIHANIESYLPQALLVMVILSAGVYSIWRSRRTFESSAGLTVLLLRLAVPVLVVLAVVLPLHPDIDRPLAARHFLPLSVAFYTLLGRSLARYLQYRAWVAGTGVLLLAGIAVSGLQQFYPDRGPAGRVRFDRSCAVRLSSGERQHDIALRP
jgi:hypothetical protein